MNEDQNPELDELATRAAENYAHAIAKSVNEALELELEKLRAENAELRKDKDRLDWLNSGNWKAERFNATVWLTRTEKGYDLNLYPTIRDAIDAQMEK